MVALIIIIIILSILIGVFITLVVGNNVNLTGDTKVKESINDDNIVEAIQTALTSVQADFLNNNGEMEATTLWDWFVVNKNGKNELIKDVIKDENNNEKEVIRIVKKLNDGNTSSKIEVLDAKISESGDHKIQYIELTIKNNIDKYYLLKISENDPFNLIVSDSKLDNNR